MNENDLIQKLRQEAPAAPPAPLGEWEAIQRRTALAPGLFGRLRLPLLGLGTAAALASAAFFFMPGAAAETPASESVLLEEYLGEASQALGRNAEKAPGEKFFALVDSLN